MPEEKKVTIADAAFLIGEEAMRIMDTQALLVSIGIRREPDPAEMLKARAFIGAHRVLESIRQNEEHFRPLLRRYPARTIFGENFV